MARRQRYVRLCNRLDVRRRVTANLFYLSPYIRKAVFCKLYSSR